MKILHVAETIKGGVATVINPLINHQAIENEVILIVPDVHYDEILLSGDAFENIKIERFKNTGRNIFSFFSLIFVYIKVLLELKPDIVHIHSTFAGFICRLTLILIPLRPKVIFCPHAFCFLMKGISNRKRIIYQLLERFLSNFTDSIICVSKNELECAKSIGIDEKKLFLVSNGVEIPECLPRKSASIHNETLSCLFVGRFDYQKGVDILIKLISMSNNNLQFTIIGDYVNDNSCYSFPDSDHVKTLGWIPQSKIKQYYLGADFLIFTSRWEGFAMVPLEAMSYALPVVAINSTSLAELITTGYNGYLFESDDLESFSNKLNSLTHSECAQLGLNAFRTVSEKYSKDDMIRKTFDVYKSKKI